MRQDNGKKTTVSLSDAALRHLSTRSRTVRELKQCLGRKGFAQEDVDDLVERFQEYGYLDDSRYCREYFRYAFARGKGKRRVFAELREKGVDASLIEAAYEEHCREEGEPDERQRAKEEAEKVLRAAGVTEGTQIPEKILARAARRLASKGYSSDVIYAVIGDLRR